MELYCKKCKRVTETHNATLHVSKNKKYMWKGFCVTCHTLQTQFATIKKVDGIFESRSTSAVP